MLNAEEKAYRYIINCILAGNYRPGDFLLELELARELNVSRTPVSRALGRLVSEGFLNKMAKKGCYIPVPTASDAALLFVARQCAEGEAAALAARNATPEEIDQIERFLADDRPAYENKDRERWATVNEAFHLGIALFSRNPYIEKWVQNTFWRSNVYIFYFDEFYKESDVVVVHETPEQHEAIMEAIRRKDQDESRRLMREHIHTTYSKLLLR